MPSISQKQHNLMEMAARGQGHATVPQEVGQEFIDADKRLDLWQRPRRFYSAEALLSFMSEKIKYRESKQPDAVLHSATPFIEKMEGNCWEMANFAYQELDAQGYGCTMIFMTAKEHLFTHTAVLAEKDGKVYWFRNGTYDRAMVPFDSVEEACDMLALRFYHNTFMETIQLFKGTFLIPLGMTRKAYLEMVTAGEELDYLRYHKTRDKGTFRPIIARDAVALQEYFKLLSTKSSYMPEKSKKEIMGLTSACELGAQGSLVFAKSDVICGHVLLRETPEGAHIESIAVASRHTYKGLAFQLLEQVKEMLAKAAREKQKDHYEITLYVDPKNTIAKHFYIRNGFVKVGMYYRNEKYVFSSKATSTPQYVRGYTSWS